LIFKELSIKSFNQHQSYTMQTVSSVPTSQLIPVLLLVSILRTRTRCI